MQELTEQQKKVLQCIRTHIKMNGYPPTNKDICMAMEFRSPTAAADHLRTLERKGAIAITRNVARGIRVLI